VPQLPGFNTTITVNVMHEGPAPAVEVPAKGCGGAVVTAPTTPDHAPGRDESGDLPCEGVLREGGEGGAAEESTIDLAGSAPVLGPEEGAGGEACCDARGSAPDVASEVRRQVLPWL
jgi:hypothetical protein